MQSGIDTQSVLVGTQLPFLQTRLATADPSGYTKFSKQDIVQNLKVKFVYKYFLFNE